MFTSAPLSFTVSLPLPTKAFTQLQMLAPQPKFLNSEIKFFGPKSGPREFDATTEDSTHT